MATNRLATNEDSIQQLILSQPALSNQKENDYVRTRTANNQMVPTSTAAAAGAVADGALDGTSSLHFNGLTCKQQHFLSSSMLHANLSNVGQQTTFPSNIIIKKDKPTCNEIGTYQHHHHHPNAQSSRNVIISDDHEVHHQHHLPPKSPLRAPSQSIVEMICSSPRWLISFILFLLVIIILTLTAIFAVDQHYEQRCETRACWEEAANIEASLNTEVTPCDDFYEFVCGKWIQNTIIPEHKPSESRFDQLQDKVKEEITSIIQTPINGHIDADFVQKTKRFYRSCLNLTAINNRGDEPLRRLIDQLGGWPILDSNWNEKNVTLIDMHSRLREIGLIDDMIQSVTVISHDKDNTHNVLAVSPATFGLMDRDFMVRDLHNDSSLQRYYRLMLYTIKLLSDRNYYEEKRANLHFDFFEYDDIEIDADIELDQNIKNQMLTVLEFEQILANNSMKKEDNRNLTLLFNNMTIHELEKMSPNIEWLELINALTKLNSTQNEEVVVIDINYVKFLDHFLPNTPMRIISNYIVWRIVKTKIGALDYVYQSLREQYNAANFGNAKPEARWQQCVAQVQTNLGAALSNLYVKNQFTSNDKDVINKIVLQIKDEFYKTLQSTDWMDHQTKENAIKKLRSMEFRIGYPDEIVIDELVSDYYDELEIGDSYFENILSISRFSATSMFLQLNETNLRDDWRKFAEVVEANAFYFHQDNAFTLNAGLLQGIFFNRNRPNYLNYGAIGEIIGHEITHGFDGFGRQFDPTGQLKNWWNHATSQMFEEKSQCIVDQYNKYYSPEVDMYVNGMNTQDENIADNGGVGLAYRAYKKEYDNRPEKEPLLPLFNYTIGQLFWISYGMVNCEKVNNEMMKLNIQLDPHTPNRFRLNGVVSNSYEFANDFACPIGTPMNPKQKCKIW